MAENVPNSPQGAVPPKPAEAAKVQPKKETVRINLPPKPTAAPTIKIPAPSAVAAAKPASAAPSAAAPVAASAAPVAAAPVAAARPAAVAAGPAPASRPMARPAQIVSGVSGLDIGLAVVAALIAIGAAVRVATLGF